jgi:Fe-S-cluster-containing dehydrogenase component
VSSISRRLFLTGSAAAACTLAIGGAGAETAEAATEPLATLLDIRKCVGCEACVMACQETNGHKYPKPEKPYPKMYPSRVKVSDWSDKRDVTDRLTPYNWLFIQHATVTIDGQETELNIPRRCMHCVNPPCVKLCPWGAARQEPNGLSRFDPEICLGGNKCGEVCPWDVPQRQTGVGLYLDLLPSLAGNGVMYKCDRCFDRLAKGEIPACIEACPEGVQTIGPRSRILAEAHRIADEIGGHVYGEDENGGTNTIYVSPVPFDEINRGSAYGPGQPHMNPVQDKMKDGNNLAAAMIVAPLAGVGVAVARMLRSARPSAAPEDDAESAKR